MILQSFCDFFGCGADVDKNRCPIGDLLCGHLGDTALFIQIHDLAGSVCDIFNAGGESGSAMVAGEQLLIAEGVDVAADCLWGYIEVLRQGLDGDKALLLNENQNFLLSLIHL